jgi:hypothetical protein
MVTYLIVPYCILLYLIVSYCILLYLIVSYCVLLCLIVSYSFIFHMCLVVLNVFMNYCLDKSLIVLDYTRVAQIPSPPMAIDFW